MNAKTTALTKKRAADGMLAIQKVAQEVQQEILTSTGFAQSVAVATGLISIYDAITDDTVAVLMALQGNPMGFKADKTYPAEVVKQCAVRAVLQGAYLHGDEFNIIAGECYLGQKFFLRKLREFPGLTDLVIDVDSPSDGKEVGNQTQLKVGGYASCKVDGKFVELYCRQHEKYGDQRMAVVAYKGDIDQAMGKAKKRIAQKLYERISGVTLSNDGESAAVTVVEPAAIESKQVEREPALQSVPGNPDATTINWAAEFELYKVTEQAVLLRDSPTDEDRTSVMTAAKAMVSDGKLDQKGYDCLQRYRDHKEQGEAV